MECLVTTLHRWCLKLDFMREYPSRSHRNKKETMIALASKSTTGVAQLVQTLGLLWPSSCYRYDQHQFLTQNKYLSVCLPFSNPPLLSSKTRKPPSHGTCAVKTLVSSPANSSFLSPFMLVLSSSALLSPAFSLSLSRSFTHLCLVLVASSSPPM